jgi:hypothetical protein
MPLYQQQQKNRDECNHDKTTVQFQADLIEEKMLENEKEIP